MLGSGTIDLAIGLIFVFAVTAAISSAITELIARYLGLRSRYLLLGLRELLDSDAGQTNLMDAAEDFDRLKAIIARQQPGGDAAEQRQAGQQPAETPPSATGALLGSPILRSQGMTGLVSGRPLTITSAGKEAGLPTISKTASPAARPSRWWRLGRLDVWPQLRGLPSYIPTRSFSEALIDLLVPDAHANTTMAAIRRSIDRLPDPLRGPLLALAKNAEADLDSFRTAVEGWYDDHMKRVSGWYKRHVGRITLMIGAIVVVLLNVNTITIGRNLYENSAIRTAVANVAVKSTSCSASSGQQSQRSCLSRLDKQLSSVAQAGLPVGWGTVADCAPRNSGCNWLDQRGIFSRHGGSGWQLLLVIAGFLITITALVPGARFWFALLAKLGPLRSTGPKPDASA